MASSLGPTSTNRSGYTRIETTLASGKRAWVYAAHVILTRRLVDPRSDARRRQRPLRSDSLG